MRQHRGLVALAGSPHSLIRFAQGNMMVLPDGLYDLLFTESLAAKVDSESAVFQGISGDASGLLVDALARQLAAILEDIPGDGGSKSLRQLELVNGLLRGCEKLPSTNASAHGMRMVYFGLT